MLQNVHVKIHSKIILFFSGRGNPGQRRFRDGLRGRAAAGQSVGGGQTRCQSKNRRMV